MQRQTVLLALGGSLAIAIAPQTMALDWTFNSIAGQNVTIRADSVNGGNSFGTKAGLFNWTVNSDGSPHFADGETVFTYCTEINESVAYNQSYTNYAFADIDDLPTSAPMGEEKARVLSRLMQYWSTAKAGGLLQKAAFQLAVWEIVWEDISVAGDNSIIGDLDLSDGEFDASGNASAIALAQTWLDAVTAAGATSSISDGFIGMLATGNQDQFTWVPLPLPAAMAGLGMFGVVARRRRSRNVIV